MRCVSAPIGLGQSHQSGAVIDRVDAAEIVAGYIEDVADEDVDPLRAIAADPLVAAYGWPNTEFLEQLSDRHLAQFRADHAIAAGKQPMNVARLAAKGQKHAGAFWQGQEFEVRHQEPISLALVESDFVSLPFSAPKVLVHEKSPCSPPPSGGRGRIQRHGAANERLKRLFIDRLALMDVDRASRAAFEAGVEEARRVRQLGAAGEGQFHGVLIGLAGADDAGALPYRNP